MRKERKAIAILHTILHLFDLSVPVSGGKSCKFLIEMPLKVFPRCFISMTTSHKQHRPTQEQVLSKLYTPAEQT